MTVSIEKLDKVKAELTITVPAEGFEEAMKKAYKDMASKIKVPGFRPGKVPMQVVEKMYGPEVFYEDAANNLIMPQYIDAVREAVEADPFFQPIARPEFDIVQIEKGKEFIFKAVVDTKQQVELGEYKGLEIQEIDGEVSEKEIDQYIDTVRDKQAEVSDVTDADAQLQKGDTANIDFVGKKDGEAFAGGSAQGYDLVIGSGSFIPGFEEQMEGMKLGEVRNVELSFPEDYYVTDLAGQPVVFEVTLNAIKRKTLPELNDEFVKDVSNFETVDAYKEDIKEKLFKDKEAEAKRAKEDAVIQKIIEGASMEIPDAMIDFQTEQMLEEFGQRIQMQGMSIEQYFQITGMTEENYKEQVKPRAKQNIESRLVLEAVAKAENLEATDEDLEAEMVRMADMYKMELDKVKEMMGDFQKDEIKKDIVLQKAIDLVTQAAVEA